MNSSKTNFFQKSLFGFVLLLALALGSIKAQSSLTGTIKDQKDQSIPYANVLLLTIADSTLVRGGVSDNAGRFEINNVSTGTFILRVSMIGLMNFFSDPFTLTDGKLSKDFGVITLAEDAVLMNGVEVVAKKPLFEQKIDRLVVNVANSITSSGTNALEVLERTPGVVVNHQSNTLSLSGKSGVVVMINGRINYMPADAVTRLLAGMSSDNIE
ncbi:MAG: carboxypeptidase-like regulatory domain-containing protein, partial [Saprospiraceae bacterium]